MEKTKSKFIYGALILTITSIISKVLGAFYKVPLINMIGSKGLGLFQLIFPIYSFFLVLISGGISLGMSKLISLENQKNEGKNNKAYLKNALLLILLLSISISLILGLISIPLSHFQGDNLLFICYLALIPALIFSSLISVFKGYFQGLENMLPTGISMIIEQAVKLCASLLFCKIFIKKSLIFAVFGAFLGISISELCACAYLAIQYFAKKNIKKVSNNSSNLSFKQCSKEILKISFPIMINNIIMPLIYAIESSIIVWLLSKATISSSNAQSLVGLEDGIVGSLVNLPTVVSTAIATALLPSITSSFNKKAINECENKSTMALRLTWLICLPCFFVFLFFSKDIVLFLYSNGLNNTAFNELNVVVDLVKLSSLNIIYISLVSVVTSILQAINKSFVPVKNLLISSVVKLIATLILVASPKFNIYGLVISDSICFSLALILDLIELKKSLNICYDIKNFILKPVFCSLLMTLVILCLKFALSGLINFRILTLISVVMGLIVYLTMIFVSKAIKKEELFLIKNMRKTK